MKSFKYLLLAAALLLVPGLSYAQFVPPAPTITQSPYNTAQTTGLAGSLVIKASAGNLAAVEISSQATAGWLLLLNATTVPSAGAVSPVKAYQVPANSSERWSFPPIAFTTGIVAVFSSATSPATYTPSATAFIAGDYQ